MGGMMLGQSLRRIAVVALGLAVALAAGLIVFAVLSAQWIVREQLAPQQLDSFSHYNDYTAITDYFFVVTSALTLVPLFLAAIIGELARIRSLLYYIVAGGAAAVVMPLIAATEQFGGAYSGPYFSIVATAGFAGGLIYWAIAGRNA
jgi:hypothetical protein